MITVVEGLVLRGRQVAAVLVQPAVVEPVDPFEGGDFDLVNGPRGALGLDQFGLVEAVDRFGEGVVVAVAGGADRGIDTGVDESFGEGDGRVLRPAIVMMNQPGQVVDALARCRVQIACSIASRTSCAVIVVAVRQPTIRRA